jgi:prevent-host-death family protein
MMHYRPRGPWRKAHWSRADDEVVTSTDAQRTFGDVMHRAVTGEHVLIVTNQNRPIVAILSVVELERLREIEAEWNALRSLTLQLGQRQRGEG